MAFGYRTALREERILHIDASRWDTHQGNDIADNSIRIHHLFARIPTIPFVITELTLRRLTRLLRP